MSGINSVGSSTPIHKIAATPVQRQVPVDAPKQLPLTDRVELSGVSHMLKTLQTNNIRTELVMSVKSQIDAGTYITNDKIDAAIDRLMDDLTR